MGYRVFFSSFFLVSIKHVLKLSRALFGRDRREESRLDLAQGFQVGLVGPLGASTPWIVKVLGGCHPHRIHGAAIYGVPWIPSIYPLYVSIIFVYIYIYIYQHHGSIMGSLKGPRTQHPHPRCAGPVLVWHPQQSHQNHLGAARRFGVFFGTRMQIQTLSWARCEGANHPGPTALFSGKVGALVF